MEIPAKINRCLGAAAGGSIDIAIDDASNVSELNNSNQTGVNVNLGEPIGVFGGAQFDANMSTINGISIDLGGSSVGAMSTGTTDTTVIWSAR
jgi:hypothetical protein